MSRKIENQNGTFIGRDGNNNKIAVPFESIDTEQASLTGRKLVAWFDGTAYDTYGPISTTAGTSDLGAITQSAIDDGAHAITWPSGQYKFDTDITSPDPLLIRGVNGDTVRPTHADYTGAGTAFSSTATAGKFTFKDLWLRGPGATSGTTGIDVDTALAVRHADIARFGDCINLTDANYSRFVGAGIANGDRGIVGNGNDVMCLGVEMRGHATAGYDLDQFNGWSIFGGSVENNDRGIDARTGGSNPSNLVVQGVYFEGNTTQSLVAVDASGAGDLEDLVVAYNRFNTTGAPADAIRVDNSLGGLLAYNHMFGSATEGIDIRSGAVETETRGEQLVDLPINDAGTRTLREGVGENGGDPAVGGQWNGHGREGLVVVDTTNNIDYHYRGGAWV